jgi:molecular chaperone GrpE
MHKHDETVKDKEKDSEDYKRKHICDCGKKHNEKCECKKKAQDDIESLTVDNIKLKEDLLRVLADMENLKKRTEQDIKNNRDYILSSVVRSFVPVADNLKRALDSYNKKPDDIKPLLDGITLISEDFMKILASYGIEKIKTVGEKFDPSLHQAISTVPSKTNADEDKIAEEIQSGYSLNGKAIKEALVVVYKKQ